MDVSAGTDTYPPPLTRGVVEGLERSRREAMVARDLGALRELISPRCTYVHSSGLVQSGAEYLDQLTSGSFGYESLDADELDVVVTGPMAVAVSRQTAAMVIDADRHVAVTRCTATWLRHDGQTRLVAFQSTRMTS